jgi:hypothetical protein
MAERKPAKKGTEKSAKGTTASGKKPKGLTSRNEPR